VTVKIAKTAPEYNIVLLKKSNLLSKRLHTKEKYVTGIRRAEISRRYCHLMATTALLAEVTPYKARPHRATKIETINQDLFSFELLLEEYSERPKPILAKKIIMLVIPKRFIT
jgi:hypothetical protein